MCRKSVGLIETWKYQQTLSIIPIDNTCSIHPIYFKGFFYFNPCFISFAQEILIIKLANKYFKASLEFWVSHRLHCDINSWPHTKIYYWYINKKCLANVSSHWHNITNLAPENTEILFIMLYYFYRISLNSYSIHQTHRHKVDYVKFFWISTIMKRLRGCNCIWKLRVGWISMTSFHP